MVRLKQEQEKDVRAEAEADGRPKEKESKKQRGREIGNKMGTLSYHDNQGKTIHYSNCIKQSGKRFRKGFLFYMKIL